MPKASKSSKASRKTGKKQAKKRVTIKKVVEKTQPLPPQRIEDIEEAYEEEGE